MASVDQICREYEWVWGAQLPSAHHTSVCITSTIGLETYSVGGLIKITLNDPALTAVPEGVITVIGPSLGGALTSATISVSLVTVNEVA